MCISYTGLQVVSPLAIRIPRVTPNCTQLHTDNKGPWHSIAFHSDRESVLHRRTAPNTSDTKVEKLKTKMTWPVRTCGPFTPSRTPSLSTASLSTAVTSLSPHSDDTAPVRTLRDSPATPSLSPDETGTTRGHGPSTSSISGTDATPEDDEGNVANDELTDDGEQIVISKVVDSADQKAPLLHLLKFQRRLTTA